MAVDLLLLAKVPSGELPGGRVEVTRCEDDAIMLSFIGADGCFQWFKFADDAVVERLAGKLEAVARVVVRLTGRPTAILWVAP